MTNKSHFYEQPEARPDRKARHQQTNKALEMTSVACPENEIQYIEKPGNPIRKYNSYQGNGNRSEHDRSFERRNRSYSTNTTANVGPTNSSLNVYNEVRYGDIKANKKRKQSKVTSDGRNGHANDLSSKALGHSNHSRKTISRKSSSGDERDMDESSGRSDSKRDLKDPQQNRKERHHRRDHSRPKKRPPSRSSKDNELRNSDLEPGRSRNEKRRHNSTSKPTSYSIPNLDPYPVTSYMKSCSTTEHRLQRVCSKRKLFMVIGFLLLGCTGALVLVGYSLGYFGK